MSTSHDYDSQFSLDKDYYIRGIDLSNWYRYYALIKSIGASKPKRVLEIGAGNNVVKNCIQPMVDEYRVLDINANFNPDYVGDSREFKQELEGKFDCVICADVLEHMPFEDLKKNLTNFLRYLTPGGKAFITIPHRRGRVLIISPFSYHTPWIFTLPAWFRGSLKSIWEQYILGKTWIDPHHCWEVDERNYPIKRVNGVIREVGFTIDDFAKLLQVDFWILKK